MTLQLVEVQKGGQLLDLNQHEFQLMTGYELCVCVCVCVLCVCVCVCCVCVCGVI